MGRTLVLGLGVLAACAVMGYIAVFRHDVAVLLIALAAVGAAVVVFAPFRFKINRPASVPVALELVALPLVVEGRVFVGSAVAAAVVLALVVYAFVRQQRTGRVRGGVVAAVLVAVALPLARPIGGYADTALALACVVLLVVSAQRRSQHEFVTSLLDGLGLYLVVNVVAHLAGVVSPAAAIRTGSLEALGGGERVIFPVASSLATPPIVAAVFVAAAALCFERAGALRRVFRLAAFAAGLFVMVEADTRMAMLAALTFLTLSIVSTRLLARIAVPATVASVAFVFVFAYVRPVVTATLSAVFSAAPGISRGNETGDLTISFRAVLWERALGFWTGSVDLGHQLIGFGVRGQEQSGASGLYAADFTSLTPNPRGISTHNSYLQQVFDGGLIGAVLLVGLLLWSVRQYAGALRTKRPGAQIALPALLAAVTTAVTEVSLAPGYWQAPTLVALGLTLNAATSRHADARTAMSGARLPCASEPDGHVEGSAPVTPVTA